MLLRQKLNERLGLIRKIEELKHCALVNTKERDEIIRELLRLLDELQTANIVINKVNSQSSTDINGTKIPLSTAVEVRKTLQAKMDIITNLINLKDGSLNVLSLLQQRDALLEEFNTIDTAICLTDWNISLY